MLNILKGIFVTALFLAYPYLVYRGIQSGMSWLAPVMFAAVYFRQAVVARNFKIRLYKMFAAIALMLGAYYLQTFTAKIMPVLIHSMLMFFFGRTLMKDKGPSLIESFVRLEFPDFPPGVSAYCRQLTIVWTAFFAANVLICTTLAIWGNNLWWTWYNGIVIYVLIGALMIGEYVYRHFRFPDLWIPDPKSTIMTMIVNGRKIWLEIQSR